VSWFLEAAPISVQCLKANLMSGFGTADDNAAMLLRFPSAIAILEASWTTLHNGVANGPIIYGTLGTIVVDGADIFVYGDRGAKTPIRVETGEPLPLGRATIGEEFLHHLETGDPLHPTLALPINLATMAILDAGMRSAESSTTEPVAKMAAR
jgi:predicted dehydrogenase